MRRSIRNFNLPSPPPQHTLGIWMCIVPREGGIWTLRWKGGEFELDLGISQCCAVIRPWVFFRFLQGLTDLQDRILPLLVNSSFKRVFKEVWRCYYGISLWKACKVFDWRRNLSLRRGSSVLTDGAFEWPFCREGREFEHTNLQKFKCPGGCPGGMLNFWIDWHIKSEK